MARRVPEEAKEDFNIFDPDGVNALSSATPGRTGNSLNSMVMDDPGAEERPQIQGDLMPGAFMSNDDCFDLFIDFIESDEWLLPIESFIDYFCLMFPTQDYNEHKPEKMKIFTEYQAIVKLNLDSFLRDILNYSKQ